MVTSNVYTIQKTRQPKNLTNIDHQKNSDAIKIVHERAGSSESDG